MRAGEKRRYTLYPLPYTLHPAPHTSHPTPFTLHPTPFPIPNTQHPTPYTLQPSGLGLMIAWSGRERRGARQRRPPAHIPVCVTANRIRFYTCTSKRNSRPYWFLFTSSTAQNGIESGPLRAVHVAHHRLSSQGSSSPSGVVQGVGLMTAEFGRERRGARRPQPQARLQGICPTLLHPPDSDFWGVQGVRWRVQSSHDPQHPTRGEKVGQFTCCFKTATF